MSNPAHSKRPAALSALAVLISSTTIVVPLLTLHVGTARADPGIIYVDVDAPGPAHDGASWATAFTSLQDALGAAASADEIWVAEGVYYPDEGAGQTDNDRTSTFTLRPGVALYGGFDPQSGADEWSERDWGAHVTVLSGDIDGDDDTDAHGVVTDPADIKNNNAYHVVTGGGVTETARLDGFTVTAGKADYFSYTDPGNGGGMVNEQSSPALTNLTFRGNWAYSHGGAMANLDNSNPTLENVSFRGNSAWGSGGGMYNHQSSPALTKATFSDNWSEENHGGAMVNYVDSSPTLTNVIFQGNRAALGGGMWNIDHSSPTLINVLFSGNRADPYGGGGMRNYRHSSPMLTNVTFSGNQADYGGGMANRDNSNPTLINCILWGNDAPDGPQIFNEESSYPTISYSDVQGSGGSGPGWDGALGTDGGRNIDVEFLFADPVAASAAPTTAGDYRLRFGSPAIDVGDNLPVTVDTDLDGNPRITDGDGDGTEVVNMGAYEAEVPFIGGVTLAGSTSGSLGVKVVLVVLVGLLLAGAGVARRH